MELHATEPFDARYDAVIVGARCAGAATALLLARRGLRVLAIDRGRYGTDTLSTHALMRGGVLQLHRWGVLDGVRAAGTTPIPVTTFYYGEKSLAIAIKPRHGVDALYAPRRALLDRLLVDEARASGAIVAHEVQLLHLHRSSDERVRGVIVRDKTGSVHRIDADIVVGADGLRSTMAQLVGARPYLVGRHATGILYGHWEGVSVEGYRWYFAPGVAAGAIPTSDGETCVFVAVPADRFLGSLRGGVAEAYGRLLAQSAPALGAAVAGARRCGRFSGFAGHAGYFRQSWGPGWALVGDAGYFKDPLTAHGITDALRDAELLADAIGAGTEAALAGYQQTRDQEGSGLFEVTDRIASFEWDLAGLEVLHESLAAEMSREVKAMVGRSSAGLSVAPLPG